ncbi:hypothetical protein [Pseudomonas sp. CCNWLW23]|uniref:hypothetical protein n=1 Tax=Pseudomonas sp. CCNWLW23 TaxID=3126385 RepID=UPI003012BC38
MKTKAISLVFLVCGMSAHADSSGDVHLADPSRTQFIELSDRYNCDASGYDSRYRGNTALSRVEFAQVLIQCGRTIRKIQAGAEIDASQQADLKTLETIENNFSSEIHTLDPNYPN